MPTTRRSLAILAGISVLAVLCLGYRFAILPMAPSVDSLFTYSFNYATANGLTWGRDFVSTFGPYGYLLLTMDVGTLVTRTIIFNLVLATGTGLAIATYIHSIHGLRIGGRFTLAMILAYAVSLPGAEYRWFVLFLLLLLTGIHLGQRMSLVAFCLAGILAGFYVLVKFSLGTNAMATLLIACCLTRRLLTVKARLAVTLPAATGSFLVAWVAYERSFAGVKAYLATGWSVGAGYSAAMSFAPERWWIGAVSFLLWFALIVLWVVMRPGSHSYLSLGVLAMPLFGAWKHSMVRQDIHVMILVTFGVFVVAILLTEAASAWGWRLTVPIAGILLVPLSVSWFNAAPAQLNAMASLEEVALGPLKLRGVTDLARLSDLEAYRETTARDSDSYLSQHRLPASLRKEIGNTSVDVYPWRMFYVMANTLNWTNRPVPSSYGAYTPVLDRLDAAFLESQKRPTHLLWHATNEAGVKSIDGRYLLWDEPRTIRVIFDFYDLVAAEGRLMVLRARPTPRFGPPQLLETVKTTWDTWIPVPESSGVLLASAIAETSLVVPMVRAVFREEPVFLSVRFLSGETVTYRVVRDQMESGVWLSPFAVTFEELRSLFQRGGGRRVVAIRFTSGRLLSSFSAITVSWTTLPLAATGAPAAR
ncbi:MAG TPA: hypothetical protein VKH83_08385 [Methylomirabilota bacterium]|nr:hypothetical protein [Methylomirabilota bacterium]